MTLYSLCVLPALSDFDLLIFKHRPEVQEASKETFSHLFSNLSSVIEVILFVQVTIRLVHFGTDLRL